MIPGLILAASIVLTHAAVSKDITTCQHSFLHNETIGAYAVERDCRKASIEAYNYAGTLPTQSERDYTAAYAAYFGMESAAALADTGNDDGALSRMYMMQHVAQAIIDRHATTSKGLQVARVVVNAATVLIPKVERNREITKRFRQEA